VRFGCAIVLGLPHTSGCICTRDFTPAIVEAPGAHLGDEVRPRKSLLDQAISIIVAVGSRATFGLALFAQAIALVE
jgi:hypothetical protein